MSTPSRAALAAKVAEALHCARVVEQLPQHSAQAVGALDPCSQAGITDRLEVRARSR